MLTKSTKETFQTLAKSAKKVAIFEEIWADKFTPISIFEALSSELGEGVLLESGIQMPDMGHYSFLAFDPFAEVRAYGLDVKKIVGKEITEQKANPFDVLRGMLKDHSCTFSNQDPDNFVGNIIGFISYDAVRYFENIPNKHASDDAPPDFLFRFYRIVLIFDHQKEIMRVYLVVDSTADPLAHYQAAQEKLAHILKKINDISERQSTKKSIEKKSLMPPDVDIDDAEFMQLV
jgi:anthranilate synthase component I